MLQNKKNQAIMHGENMLVPVARVPEGAQPVELNKDNTDGRAFIFGHSETGHNHLMEAEKVSDISVFFATDGHTYIKVKNHASITHKKSFDIHEPIKVAPGVYKVNKKTEYDPFRGIVREVFD